MKNKDEFVEAQIQDEGKAYFDKEKNRWVFEGEEDLEEETVVKPPPLLGQKNKVE